MRCASCGFDNREGARFCNECATPLALRCRACGSENRAGAKFCSECGTPLTKQAEASPPSQTASQRATPQADTTPLRSSFTGPEAERRQLTVLFCDLVGSTALSTQLDPEDLREVVRQYQEACEQVIHRFEGYVARYVGDALLVYCGYPAAHEDDAQRAVRAGLGIIEAMPQLNARLRHTLAPLQHFPLQVRIGIHTGLVVVGELGGKDYREAMALGETPNIAARLQGRAEPNTVLVSVATHRLVAGFFDCQDLGVQVLKGLSAPVQVYRILSESNAQSRLEMDVSTGKLTPLVGRAHEVGLILERWAAAQAGDGQVVLLSGEPGIGKSRLVQEVKEQVVQQGATSLEFRCSPYYHRTVPSIRSLPICNESCILHATMRPKPSSTNSSRPWPALGSRERIPCPY